MMTNTTLKVLGELSNEEHKALLLELPQDMLEELVIESDGSVDTQQLLQFLIKLSKQKESSKSEALSLHEEIELMLNIYDSNRAANFANKARMSKAN
ncbi:MAG: hypothetical protein K0S29_764 [Gammaproteobacteria bacterium]|jgi:Ca2+-binding EF-hand superfamily protein|nr:hypothetical protein [Gammaproteobacteria bacterium]